MGSHDQNWHFPSSISYLPEKLCSQQTSHHPQDWCCQLPGVHTFPWGRSTCILQVLAKILRFTLARPAWLPCSRWSLGCPVVFALGWDVNPVLNSSLRQQSEAPGVANVPRLGVELILHGYKGGDRCHPSDNQGLSLRVRVMDSKTTDISQGLAQERPGCSPQCSDEENFPGS